MRLFPRTLAPSASELAPQSASRRKGLIQFAKEDCDGSRAAFSERMNAAE